MKFQDTNFELGYQAYAAGSKRWTAPCERDDKGNLQLDLIRAKMQWQAGWDAAAAAERYTNLIRKG